MRFRRTSEAWRIAGENWDEALVSRRMKRYLLRAWETLEEALRLILTSLRFARRVEDPEAEAAALNALARVCLDVGRMQEATSHAQHALELSRADHSALAPRLRHLTRSATSTRSVDGSPNPLPSTGRRSTFRGHGGIRAGEAGARLNQGYSQADLGQTDAAQASYEAALSLWQVLRDRRGQAAARTALGHLYIVVGENERALGEYRQASALAQPLGDSIALARIQAGLGRYTYELGGTRGGN